MIFQKRLLRVITTSYYSPKLYYILISETVQLEKLLQQKEIYLEWYIKIIMKYIPDGRY
jgi:hypothetical protein